MGYLVIQNGTTKKSYQLTNTCNKPRIKVSNSYIPLTNNNKTGLRCKINNNNIAEYLSYTSTSNKQTITITSTITSKKTTYTYTQSTKSISWNFSFTRHNDSTTCNRLMINSEAYEINTMSGKNSEYKYYEGNTYTKKMTSSNLINIVHMMDSMYFGFIFNYTGSYYGRSHTSEYTWSERTWTEYVYSSFSITETVSATFLQSYSTLTSLYSYPSTYFTNYVTYLVFNGIQNGIISTNHSESCSISYKASISPSSMSSVQTYFAINKYTTVTYTKTSNTTTADEYTTSSWQ